MNTKYDIIIIGSGVGGSAVGALLAHAGRKVLILEKNRVVGGRCTSYQKDGFTVDLGVHLFGVGNNGSLGDICRRIARLDTPDVVNGYAGEEGNIIGVGQTVDQIHERRPSVKSPLEGLYFASAEAGGHGIGAELAADSARELFRVLVPVLSLLFSQSINLLCALLPSLKNGALPLLPPLL